MATISFRRGIIDELAAYPLLVTGQVVSNPETPRPRRPAVQVDGTGVAARRRPFVRLHHTSRYGVR